MSGSDARQVIDALAMPAMLIGAQERVVLANGPATALFGRGLEGRHYISAFRQPGLLDAVESVLRGGGPRDALYLAVDGTRDTSWAAHAAPALDGVLLTLEDRTAVLEAGEMRRDFVANVSHELRTPLTALLGFIETLRGAARDDPAARDRFLGIMAHEATRMSRLVRDLLSLSRVEAEERMRPTARVRLADLLRVTVAGLAPTAKAAGAAVTVTVSPDAEPRSVLGDEDQLSQLFANLVENGVKYGGGSVRVECRAEAHCAVLRVPALVVTVSDDGPGIDPIHIPRLTERFYRVDTHRSRDIGGTGLGLAIVKHVVGRHRGRLRIQSAPGRGSAFAVYLAQA